MKVILLLACLGGVAWGSDTAKSDRAPIRLVNGSSHCSGRVEVFHEGQWGTVCHNHWGMEEARVVCRELGCLSAISAPGRAHFGIGTGPIWLDEVRCSDRDTALSRCIANPWGQHQCHHGEDAGVVCLEVKLVNGPNSCAGRVEVLRGQEWGTVCDNGWGMNEARVVCRELGCGGAKTAPGGAVFGQGSGPTWMDGVKCTGSEETLSRCPASPVAEHSCDHSKDASVECEELPEIRLVNGFNRCSGRVEIYRDRRWGTIHDEGWDLEDAKVVCHYLKCGAALSAPRGAHFGAGSGPIWLDGVNCTGTEESISACPTRPQSRSKCAHIRDAGVICGVVRLMDGPNRCSGRIEVYHDGQWGTISDDGWNLKDAQVVCQEMNCGNALSALRSARYGQGSGTIWSGRVNCTGNETSLRECLRSPLEKHSGDHTKDASVECSSQIRLTGGENECSGKLEVFHNRQWGTVCDDEWDMNNAKVVCRELNCGIALEASQRTHYGKRSDPIWLTDVTCNGTEAALVDCRTKGWDKQNCSHREDVTVTCSDLRLVSGSSHCSGRVEIFHNKTWQTISDANWAMKEAEVVCRQRGCGTASKAHTKAFFGQGSGAIWANHISCKGTETSLSECTPSLCGPNSCQHGEDVGVECEEPPEIRLANGPHHCSGRVEIYHERIWGTVCDDNWGLEDANVVCHYLGCGNALSAPRGSHFRRGSGPTWLDEVSCTGTEKTISQCPARPWGQHDCSHNEDASVVCAEIRLVNGPNHCSGRVEVYRDEQWGTICDDGWDKNNAEVVCRESNCGNALSALGKAHYGQGSGAIWPDKVNCKGNETTLRECPRSPQEYQSCDHGRDVSVECEEPKQIRVVSGSGNCSGRVEVFHNQKWGTVCDDEWDINSAQVACQELGCGRAISAPRRARFGEGDGPIWLDDVKCRGTEASLKDCQLKGWGNHDCNHTEDAGVVCSVLRLVNVSGSGHCSGRVEVLHNHQWRPICSDHWGTNEAKVVCREIGCGAPKANHTETLFGCGTGSFCAKDITCTGEETSLSECASGPWGLSNCHHGKGLVVECSEIPEIRLVNGFNNCSGRVEIHHDTLWGTICDDDWDLEDADVVCRHLGCGVASSAPRESYFGGGSGPIWLDDVSCLGTEDAISKCPAKPWGKNDCSHNEDANVICGDVRLVNGPNRCSGRVEVYRNKQWGTICDDGWDIHDAQVVCRQIYCGNASSALGRTHYGQGSGTLWPDRVNCMGNEPTLRECPRSPQEDQSCDHGRDVSVECAEPKEIRLVNGPNRCSGRVEVYHKVQWGTICDNNWNMETAQIVCRELGCGKAISAPGRSHFGEGSGRIWLDDVKCTGTEASLKDCKIRHWGEHNCNHEEDAGVVCSG